MNNSRWNILSVEEPNAFRISRPPPSFGSQQSSTHNEDNASNDPKGPNVNYARLAQDLPYPPIQAFEPASWLASSDLSSASFNAHDFLQRVLSPKYDKASRPSQLPVLEEAFDADAALAALDTVESALRKKREIAKREEDMARDELRKALHLCSKKREHLTRTADAVTGSISSVNEVGRQAVSALGGDVSHLKSLCERLATLQDARDLVALLTGSTHELNAVRVSKLLTDARQCIDDNGLAALLSEKDMNIAREETRRCEKDLASSIYSWMRNAVDIGNAQVVRECAMAADELHISDQFIDAYISHAFSFEHTNDGTALDELDPYDGRDPGYALEQFKLVSWEASNSLNEAIPTIRESFSDPMRPLAAVLRVLSEKKVLTEAEKILHSFLRRIHGKDENNESPDHAQVSIGRSSVERIKSLSVSDEREHWRETAKRRAFERKKFLNVCTELLKYVSKLKAELLAQCHIPRMDPIDEVFKKNGDIYLRFIGRWVSEYLMCEKSWLDEQFGTAFFEITRIETHISRLAPKEKGDVDAYHRYRAFYGAISLQYMDMTKSAIRSANESLRRITSVLSILVIRNSSENLDFDYGNQSIRRQSSSNFDAARRVKLQLSNDRGESFPSLSAENEAETCFEESDDANQNSGGPDELKKVLREILDGLVMSYLANSETILQAATHLLPVSKSDAQMQELWENGASPFTAYMSSIHVLTRSNEMLDEFLLTLETCDTLSPGQETIVLSWADLSAYVPEETREVLHRDLTTGLSDLALEAQVGVKAAVAAVRARLVEILSSTAARQVYSSIQSFATPTMGNDESMADRASLEIESSPAFIKASAFMEQQLQSALSNVQNRNRIFVVSELGNVTKEVVLRMWCNCKGPISVAGALQLIADGRAMRRVFQKSQISAANVDCLPTVGQLFLESADGLWKCVESKSLADVEANILIALLRKREDCTSERVVKVCQSLGASFDSVGSMV